jgi:hypothetical protein
VDQERLWGTSGKEESGYSYLLDFGIRSEVWILTVARYKSRKIHMDEVMAAPDSQPLEKYFSLQALKIHEVDLSQWL